MQPIMIADRHSVFRHMSRHVLEASGYTVFEVESMAALQLRLSTAPEVILLLHAELYNEPVADRGAFFTELRRHRVIGVMESGGLGFPPEIHPVALLTKPFSVDDLRVTVAFAVNLISTDQHIPRVSLALDDDREKPASEC